MDDRGDAARREDCLKSDDARAAKVLRDMVEVEDGDDNQGDLGP